MTKTSTISIILIICLITLTSARFSCGNDGVQAQFAELFIKSDCKGRLQSIDNCCARHTQCYAQKKNRNKCDQEFCQCSKKAAQKLPFCQLKMDQFCATAKAFGGFNFKG